jgi:hypothetical protein
MVGNEEKSKAAATYIDIINITKLRDKLAPINKSTKKVGIGIIIMAMTATISATKDRSL